MTRLKIIINHTQFLCKQSYECKCWVNSMLKLRHSGHSSEESQIFLSFYIGLWNCVLKSIGLQLGFRTDPKYLLASSNIQLWKSQEQIVIWLRSIHFFHNFFLSRLPMAFFFCFIIWTTLLLWWGSLKVTTSSQTGYCFQLLLNRGTNFK